MSDVMLFGILRMPLDMAMGNEWTRHQFYQAAQEALTRMEKAETALIAQNQDAIATLCCGAINERNLGPERYSDHINAYLPNLQKICNANPGARIPLYADTPPAAPPLNMRDEKIQAHPTPEGYPVEGVFSPADSALIGEELQAITVAIEVLNDAEEYLAAEGLRLILVRILQ